MLLQYMLQACVCVCVCLIVSITSQSSAEMAECRTMQTSQRDSPGTLAFCCQKSPQNSTRVTPKQGHQMQLGWVRVTEFQQITHCILKKLQDSHSFY